MWNAAETARMNEAKAAMEKAANCRRADAHVAAAFYEACAASAVEQACASFTARTR